MNDDDAMKKELRKRTRIHFCEWMENIIQCSLSDDCEKENAAALKLALETGALDGHEGRYIYLVRGSMFPRTYENLQYFERDPEWDGGDPEGRLYFIPDQEFIVAYRR